MAIQEGISVRLSTGAKLLFFLLPACIVLVIVKELIIVPLASQEEIAKIKSLYSRIASCDDDQAVRAHLESLSLDGFVVKRIDEIGPFGGPYWHIQTPMRLGSARNWVLYIVLPNKYVEALYVRILDNERTMPSGAPPDKAFAVECCAERTD